MKKLLVGVLILVIFQWLGEFAAALLGINLPGQLLGMIFLLLVLSFNTSLLPWLESASSQLIRYIALLFVPVTTGAFFLAPAITGQFPKIVIILVVSTTLAQWFMGLIIKRVSNHSG